MGAIKVYRLMLVIFAVFLFSEVHKVTNREEYYERV
jgi:hypothetical protein